MQLQQSVAVTTWQEPFNSALLLITTLCLKKLHETTSDNLNSKCPIVTIFGTVITIGHRKVVSLSHFTYFVQLPYPGNLLNLKIRRFSPS